MHSLSCIALLSTLYSASVDHGALSLYCPAELGYSSFLVDARLGEPMFRDADLIWISDQQKDLLSLEDELTTSLEASVSKVFGGKIATARKQGKKRYLLELTARAARTGIWVAWTGNDFLTLSRKLFRDRIHRTSLSELSAGQLCVIFGHALAQELQLATCATTSLPTFKARSPDRALRAQILGVPFTIQLNTIEEILGTSVLLDHPTVQNADSILVLCRISRFDPLEVVPLAILNDPQITDRVKRRLASSEAVAAWTSATTAAQRKEVLMLFDPHPAETTEQDEGHSSPRSANVKVIEAENSWKSNIERLQLDLARLRAEMEKTSLFSSQEIDLARVRTAQLALLFMTDAWGNYGAPIYLYSEYRRRRDADARRYDSFRAWLQIVDDTSEAFNELAFITESGSFRVQIPDRLGLDYFRGKDGAVFAFPFPFEHPAKQELWCNYVIPSTVLTYGAAAAYYNPYRVVEWGLA